MKSSLSKSFSSKLPPLKNGDTADATLRDRLTRPDFERRYQAMPELKKAELIEGVVYIASPLRFTPHAEPHGRLITWLGVYQAAQGYKWALSQQFGWISTTNRNLMVSY